jgi:hypothetical protein
VNVSPTDDLAGYAPASTVGVTSVIGMRPVMVAVEPSLSASLEPA